MVHAHGVGHALKTGRHADDRRRHGGDPHVRIVFLIALRGQGFAESGPAVNDGDVRQLVGILERQKYLVGRGRGHPVRRGGNAAACRLFPAFQGGTQPALQRLFNGRVVALVLPGKPLVDSGYGYARFPRKPGLAHAATAHFLAYGIPQRIFPHIRRCFRGIFPHVHIDSVLFKVAQA